MNEQKPPEGQLRAFIEAMKHEAGGNDEIVKQCVADLNAGQRQDLRNNFEARLEFTRQVAARNLEAHRGILEYGLQTLRWSFLLNAGAIALIAAYVGGALGRGGGTISFFTPMLKALWPFAVGCLFVTLAGASAYFNFAYLAGC
jgi:hypothetical protein